MRTWAPPTAAPISGSSEIFTSPSSSARVQVVGEVRDARAQVVVEAGPDALLGDSADHGGEHAQDPERQRGGDDGQLEADRQAGPHGSLTT